MTCRNISTHPRTIICNAVMYVILDLFFICFQRDDYLTFRDDRKQSFGKYCGSTTGGTFMITGNYTLINFHSGNSSNMTRIGFVLRFEAVDQPGNVSQFPVSHNIVQFKRKAKNSLQI